MGSHTRRQSSLQHALEFQGPINYIPLSTSFVTNWETYTGLKGKIRGGWVLLLVDVDWEQYLDLMSKGLSNLQPHQVRWLSRPGYHRPWGVFSALPSDTSQELQQIENPSTPWQGTYKGREQKGRPPACHKWPLSPISPSTAWSWVNNCQILATSPIR